MANPWHHAVSSVRKWGGLPTDYLAVHKWFDESKAHHADFRHRALRHHSQGIFWAEEVFGPTITLTRSCSSCAYVGPCWTCPTCITITKERVIPVRWIGEQHVREDMGRIPTLTDWLTEIAAQPWMARARQLSRELEEATTCSPS